MHFRVLLLMVFVLMFFERLTASGQAGDPTAIRRVADATFHKGPNLPGCGVVSGVDGDSLAGQSIVFIRMGAGCVIPWHWHTPNERVLMVSGSATAQMRGMSPQSVGQGDFLLMSSRHIHQFTAVSAVEFFVMSDGMFDIHYVGTADEEISAATALEKVGETAGTIPVR